MRLFTLFEDAQGEYIPFDRTKSTAYDIGSQLARAALAKTGGKRDKAKRVADQMANKLLSDITATIDDELGMQQKSTIDDYA